jgi:hypothetical protein
MDHGRGDPGGRRDRTDGSRLVAALGEQLARGGEHVVGRA